jgi:hypothetical protein
MTAKEEANKIYDSFIDYSEGSNEHYNTKQCALISINDRMISIKKFIHPFNTGAMNRRVERELKRLEQVKEELNKL